MDCIRKTCAHPKQQACKLFGQCGAGYALSMAQQPCGYEVRQHDNPTIGALLRDGLVRKASFNGSTMIVRAVS